MMTDYPSLHPKQPFPRSGDDLAGAAEFLYEGLSHKVVHTIRSQQRSSVWDEDQKYTKPISQAQNIWRRKLPSKTHIGLIIIWVVVLWWGERGAFSASVSNCSWSTWEQWVSLLSGLRRYISGGLANDTDSRVKQYHIISSWLRIHNLSTLTLILDALGRCRP